MAKEMTLREFCVRYRKGDFLSKDKAVQIEAVGAGNILWQKQIKVGRFYYQDWRFRMARLDYEKETFEKVSVCSIECEFSDMRIDRNTIPEGKYQHEVAGDDESGGDPARIQWGIMVNFFGTLICSEPLPIGDDGVLWLEDGDFVWL